MSQLKMYWLQGTPIEELTLPEGYSVSNYKCEADKLSWVECCKNGLLGDNEGVEAFTSSIENHDDLIPETDVFFLDYKNEHIATATAVCHPGNIGELHMVGMKLEFRGKGLAKYLNNAAVKKLAKQNVKYIYLTTDEWRKGAIKGYINAGFKPVEYDLSMTQRWESVLADFGIDSIDMVDENGEYFKTLHKMGWDKNERKIRIGVFGAGRGKTMINYCKTAGNAKLVAVCDKFKPSIDALKKDPDISPDVAFYDNFEDFIEHDMDAVILANYSTEHAPFAIRCMEKGLDVLSEVHPVQTMKEAVELCECVERTGRLYAYAENYCFMPVPREMRRMFADGKLGEFEYGEGEYLHNCEPIWHNITQGDPTHWRNNMYASFYCTHSIGPLIHISQLRPVSVTCFEAPFNKRMERMGAKAGHTAVEIITLENGALVKSVHGVGCSKCSVWYSVYGEKGTAESSREIAYDGGVGKIIYEYDDTDVAYPEKKRDEHYYYAGEVKDELSELSEKSGHGGSDFYTMYFFCERLLGDKNAEVIEVYEALDMFFPGILGYQSVLKGGIPVAIPNFRNKEEREKYRNDTACTDPAVAGEQLIPSYSKGNPDIPDTTYKFWKDEFEKELEKRTKGN